MKTLLPRSLSLLILGLGALSPAGCGGSALTGSAGAGSSGSGSSAGGGSSASSTGSSGSGGMDGGSACKASGDQDHQLISKPASGGVLEAEPHVAAAPNCFVAVAWTGETPTGSTNGYTFSTDDGATFFTPPSALDSPGGRMASDPTLAVDGENNFYMAWVGFMLDAKGKRTDMHVYAAMAPAGTTAFGAAVEVTDMNESADYDRPRITVSGTSILVSYAKTSTGGIYVAETSAMDWKNNKPWSRIKVVEDGGFRKLIYPCSPATGSRVYIVYHAGGAIGLRWSDDNGATWPSINKTSVSAAGESPAFEGPTCVAAGNDVWVTYGLSDDPFSEATMPKLSKIRIAHSGDSGPTIDYRIDAQDSAASVYFMHPQLSREPGGALDMIYYAGDADGDANGSVRRSRSLDSGKTWEPSKVIHQPITYQQARGNLLWLGDHAGLAFRGESLYVSYTDNSQGGTSHVSFFKVKVP